eukprot:scaffold139664_cov55-Attheya_sp.AAC.1
MAYSTRMGKAQNVGDYSENRKPGQAEALFGQNAAACILILLLVAVLTARYSVFLLKQEHFGNHQHLVDGDRPLPQGSSSSSFSSAIADVSRSNSSSVPDVLTAAAGGQEEEESALFPSPLSIIVTHDEHKEALFVLLEPTYGTHRPERDAVFCFAEGYPLSTYVLFIESLKDTGFEGDIVLSVSSPDKMAPKVHDYLKQQALSLLQGGDDSGSDARVVVYTVSWECWKKNGEKFVQRGTSTTKDGFADCQIHGLYGYHDDESGNKGTPQPIKDPRIPRPVATA